MMEYQTRGQDHVEIADDPAVFAEWPEGLREEMLANRDNGCVGTVLVSETDRVRVWHLTLAPGTRCPFHRHVNPYFWSCHTDGRAVNYLSSGEIRESRHFAGQTRHYQFGAGEHMLHSVENIGETDLVFTTVEFMDGTNPPLPVSDERRLVPSEVAAE
ncbi:MAG: hypothetical protein ACFB6S_20040 [Geminicoccaceae bacterium]